MAALLLWGTWPIPAAAQLAAAGAVASDYRYRGLSLSDGRPALSLDLSYDPDLPGPGGAYVGGSLIAAPGADSSGPNLNHIEYIGYSRPLGARLVWDAGASHAEFARYGGATNMAGAFEAYAGLRLGGVAAYLHYSPDYFASGQRTLYAETLASVRAAAHWRLFARMGVLTPLGGAPIPYPLREQYDAAAGVAALLSSGEIRLTMIASRPGPYAGQDAPGRDALVLEASWFF